jgi:hypothetical protein
LELPLLLSLGALASESLSTRRDSVRAPDLLCVDEDLLDPDDRLRELVLDRLVEEDERFLDLDEAPLELLDEEPLELPERFLLLDRDFCWGILPYLLLTTQTVFGAYPHTRVQHATHAVPKIILQPFKPSAQRVSPDAHRRRDWRCWHGSQERR